MDTTEFLQHYGVPGMKWGVLRSGKRTDRIARKVDKAVVSFDRGSRRVNADTFRNLSRSTRRVTYKTNKRIAKLNRFINSTKGETVNNLIFKFKKNPEKVKLAKDFIERSQIQTKKLSEIRTSIMDVKLDLL